MFKALHAQQAFQAHCTQAAAQRAPHLLLWPHRIRSHNKHAKLPKTSHHPNMHAHTCRKPLHQTRPCCSGSTAYAGTTSKASCRHFPKTHTTTHTLAHTVERTCCSGSTAYAGTTSEIASALPGLTKLSSVNSASGAARSPWQLSTTRCPAASSCRAACALPAALRLRWRRSTTILAHGRPANTCTSLHTTSYVVSTAWGFGTRAASAARPGAPAADPLPSLPSRDVGCSQSSCSARMLRAATEPE